VKPSLTVANQGLPAAKETGTMVINIWLVIRVLRALGPALLTAGALGKGKGRLTGAAGLAQKALRIFTGGRGGDIEARAIGTMIATGLETGIALYSKPGLRATVDSLVMSITKGEAEKRDYPKELESHADRIISLFNEKGINPKRLALDGVPGSGKSTLSRILADKLSMQWKSLDHMNLDKPIDFSAEGAVYEHHRLLRTQDIDWFDAIIYIDEPVEISKKQVLKRKRGGYLVDIMDYDKLKRVGKKAFDIAEGETFYIPGSYLKVKIRPEGGFRAYENIVSEMEARGVGAEGMSKEELIFLSTEQKARDGFLAYVNASAYNKEIFSGLARALLKMTGKGRR